MSISNSIAVPNAVILVSDVGGGTPPEVMGKSLVASTPSCIAVGCMSDTNGKTEIILGGTQEVDPRDRPVFVGELRTPTRAIGVWTVLRELILQAPVPRPSTRVRIWVSHPTEPDKVTIGFD